MIRFRYEPTFEDWFAFNRIVVLRQLRFLNVLAVVILTVFLIYPFALRAVGHDEGGVLEVYRKNLGVLFIPGLTGFLLGATYYGVRKRWRTAEEIRDAREYEINDDGVRVTGSSLSGYLERRHFTRAERRGGYFLLKTAQNQFHYFPEAVVPDAKALDKFLNARVTSRKG